MFTVEQKKRVDEIIRERDARPKIYTAEQLSWRYAVWKGDVLVGEQNILGEVTKMY